MTDLPTMRLKALVSFPAVVFDGVGVDVIKQNGGYQFDLAYNDFAPPVSGVTDAGNQVILLWNAITHEHVLVPISVLLGAGAAFPSDDDPLPPGVADPGVSALYARGDHVHPGSASVQPLDADLTAIAALTGTGIARRTATDTWSVGDLVTNAELAQMAAFTIKANNTGSAAAPVDLSVPGLTQIAPANPDFLLVSDTSDGGALRLVAWTSLPGASGGIGEAPTDGQDYARNGLAATWVAISTSGGVVDDDYGDIVVSGAGTIWTIDSNAVTNTKLAADAVTTAKVINDAVTNAKLADMAANTIKGAVAAGDPVDLSAAQVSTILGLGTAALKNTGTTGNTVPLLDGDNTWTGVQGYDEVALTPTTPITWNVDAAPVATVALNAGATTMNAPSSVVAGRVYTIRFVNASPTPGTVAWNTAFDFHFGTVPIVTATAGAIDRFTFIGRPSGVLEEIGRSQNIGSP